MFCSRWFAVFILVFHIHVKTGNNDDFIAYLNVMFNGCCSQVFLPVIKILLLLEHTGQRHKQSSDM